MIQAGFFTAFNYIANNRWAQVVLCLGVGYALLQLYARHNRKIGERNLRLGVEKAQRAANDNARAQVQTIKEETHERVERTREAVASIPANPDASELSDASRSRYITK